MIGVIQLFIFFNLIEASVSILGIPDLLVLVLVTMLIAGSGYVINDYYDYRIDQINKPENWIAGNQMPLKGVIKLYCWVIGLGAFLSLFLALRLSLLPFLFIYPISIGGLWWYSYALKCKPVIGNLWVSAFCAGVVMIVALPDLIGHNDSVISSHLYYYAVFAFLVTWYRELVKDIEDKDGDQMMGCRTFVVRYGIPWSKYLALAIVSALVFAVFQWTNSQTNIKMEIALNVLQGFIITSMALVWWAKDKSYFRMASLFIKGVMLLGTIVLLLL